MTEAVDTAVYREDARTYRGLLGSLLLVPVLFGLDLAVTGRHGALTHLPGWIVAGLLLVGVHGLLLHAVRSTHSLSVTPEDVVVGDESLPRAEIVGVTPTRAPDPDLAALGWPNGFPRKAAAVTVRLADGRDVLVPTRFPERLQQVLGVGAPEPEVADPVRVARDDDLALLESIDERADTIFRVAGYALPDDPDGRVAGEPLIVFVAHDPPVGYVVVEEVDGEAHVGELAVLPSSMRRGLGSALLARACAWAEAAGYPAITLTTFADVAWNGPFYAARGFVELAPDTPQLRAIRAHEVEVGLDAVGRRVVMRRALSPAPPA